MPESARRLSTIAPSPTLAISAKAKALKASGAQVLNLSLGEPDFDTPRHIREAAVAAMDRGETHYTAADGTSELKSAIINKLRRDQHLAYEASEIIVSNGAKQSLFNLCLACLNPEDEVLIPAPYWVSYPAMVHLAEAQPIPIECSSENGFKLTADVLSKSINPRTRLLILNSPNNPSGACYSVEELRALGQVLAEHPQVLIGTDDIYEHLLYDELKFANLITAVPALRDRTVIINGVSKAYAMTGWRIGYAAGPSWLVAAMKKLQSQSTSGPSSISQAAAAAALNGAQDSVVQMRDIFAKRRHIFVPGIQSIRGLNCVAPDGAFYAFVNCQAASRTLELEGDVQFAEWLLDTLRIAAVPGSAFGTPGYVRFSYACSQETLEESLDRLSDALGKA